MTKNKTLNVFCTYSENSVLVSDTYGKDGPYTGFSETSTDTKLTGVSNDMPDSYLYELVPVKDWNGKDQPADVFVVCVIYSTGSTFGRETGCLNIEGVYVDYDEAKKVAKSIRDDTYAEYAAWKGYFEDLESVYVQSETIGKQKIVQF